MNPSVSDRIEKQILIQAPRQRVWRALTNIEEFASWFCVKASGPFEPGQRVDMVSTHPCGNNAHFWLVVEAMTPETLFSWRWHPGSKPAGANSDDEPSTLVEFRLEDADGGTRVTVSESGFDGLSLARRAKAFADNDRGWDIQMAALHQYAGSAS